MKTNKRLASFLMVLVFLFLLVPSGEADSIKTINPVKVNIGNEAKGGSSNIKGAEMELYEGLLDFSKPPVATWTTGDVFKTLILNPGTYTLKEKTPPPGYEPAEPIVFKVDDEKVYVEDDDDTWTPQYPEKRPDETKKYYGYYERYNLTQEPKMYVYPEGYRANKKAHSIVYCFNHYKEGTPAGPADGKNEWRYYVKLEDATQWDELAESPRAENQEEFEQNILRVILNGYPRNMSNLRGRMSDGDFYEATQLAVWYYTDSVPLEKWRYADFYNVAKKSYVVDMAEKIVNSKVPNNMKDSTLNIFLPRGDNPNKYQSLISTDSVKKDLTKEYSITMFNKKRPNKQTIKIGKIDKNHYVIPGANFEIYDLTTNQLVEKWTSEKGPHYKYLYLHPGEYLVKETKAPDGYIPVSDFTIVVGEDGSAKIKHKESWDDIREWKHGEIAVVNYQEKEKVWLTVGKVTGQKQNPDTLYGAELQLLDELGKEVDKWISPGGLHQYHYVDIVPGIYYLKELKAPDGGYKPIKPVKFSINKEGKLEILEKGDITDDVFAMYDKNGNNLDKNGNNTIRVYNHKNDAEVGIRVGKLDRTQEPSWTTGWAKPTVPGAKLQILDQTGTKVVFEWESPKGKEYQYIPLSPGEYIFHEVEAPKQYFWPYKQMIPVSDVRFRLYQSGRIEILEKDERDEIDTVWKSDKGYAELRVSDDVPDDKGYEVTFDKVSEYTNTSLKGAKLQILNEDGTEVIKSWISGTSPEKMYLKYGNYIFREIYAPTGYKEVRDIFFKVNQYGEIEIIKKENPRDIVEITNEYEVRQVEEYILGESGKHTIDKKITTLSKMTVTDKRKDYNFYVRKEDSRNGRFLPDAEFQLFMLDTKTGNWEYLRTDKTSRSSNMSDRGLIYYSNYLPGKYKLVETKAPPGYNLLKNHLVFEIKEDGTLEYSGKEGAEIKAYECETIIITNKRGAKLPDAGGDGNRVRFILAGIFIFALGLLIALVLEENGPYRIIRKNKN